MNSACNSKGILALAAVALLVTLPGTTFAGITYQPLVGIPGVDNAASNFNQYINQLYFVSISIAALLAVIKIIIGGVKWMLTDVVTSKQDAKNDIRSALLGLLLIIAAFLILNTINPQLTNLSVLQDAPRVRLEQPQNTPAASGPNNGSNPAWVAGQQERCETGGGTWSAPNTMFRNGNCTYPRGTTPRVQGTTPAGPNCPSNTFMITSGRCYNADGEDITPNAANPAPASNEPAPDFTPAGA